MAKMVSLARTAAEKKSEDHRFDGPSVSYNDPEGLTVRLEHRHMEKLGLDKPLPYGHEVTIHAKGRVSQVSSHEDGNSGPRHSMSIELTHANLEHEPVDGDEEGGHSLRAMLQREHEKQAANPPKKKGKK